MFGRLAGNGPNPSFIMPKIAQTQEAGKFNRSIDAVSCLLALHTGIDLAYFLQNPRRESRGKAVTKRLN
jgi:hypothetical protein